MGRQRRKAVPYVAYYRCSTERQGRSGLGLDAQRQAVIACIGKEPEHSFTEVESGKRGDRPQLAKALDLAELTNSTLIVAKLDRLSRNAAFLLRLLESKVKIVFADMPEANRMTIGVMAMLAEWEGAQISKRTKDALAAAKARGTQLGGNRTNDRDPDEAASSRGADVLERVRATGIAASAAKRSATARERNAKVRAHIDVARSEGHTSLGQIAGYLNSRGFKTARGANWTPTAVRRTLGN
jgi:DNA invertase Pin-like site-specific DNA recombinase